MIPFEKRNCSPSNALGLLVKSNILFCGTICNYVKPFLEKLNGVLFFFLNELNILSIPLNGK